MQTQSKIQEIRKALNGMLFERQAFIDGLLVALLAKEHMYVLGPPGTAKSYGIKLLVRALQAALFSWQISKTSTPEELFGSLSMQGIKEDDYRRITTHKLPEAQFAFLDEIGKGSSAILNALLGILGEEREFCNGKAGMQKVQLQTCLAASNELPEGPELAALWDRFPLRYTVDYLKNRENRRKLLKGDSKKVQLPTITADELKAEQDLAAKVVFPESLEDTWLDLQDAIKDGGFQISDRKWAQSKRIVQAYAHLNGHTEVQADDLEILENVLWSDTNERKQVQKIVRQHANPLGEQILQLTDGVSEVLAELGPKPDTKKAVEAASKIDVAITELKKLGNPKENKRLAEAVKSATKAYNRLLAVSLNFKHKVEETEEA